MKSITYAALIGVLLTSAAPVLGATETIRLADTEFVMEVVADPDSRRQGLMGREELPFGTGMLFDFPEGTRPAIWMRNMVISLDLVFVAADGRIAHLFPRVPPCADLPCAIYQADGPLRWVLELPAGTVDKLGLKVGDNLDLSVLPPQPPLT
ncbi:MAG: DUF192 domain-containing protein [Pseudomonadaceae bacterium]